MNIPTSACSNLLIIGISNWKTARLVSDLKLAYGGLSGPYILQEEAGGLVLSAGQDRHAYASDLLHVRQEGSHGWQVLTVEF